MIDPALKGHIPALQCLLEDRRTIGAPRDVYMVLVSRLDLYEFTPVKLQEVFIRLAISKRTAIRALQALVELGYLQKGPPMKAGGNIPVNSYRLIWLCPVGSQMSPPKAS